MLWEEILRWIESPTRRLILLAYGGMVLTVLWVVLLIIWLVVYQRVVLTLYLRDLDYVYQWTHFFGRGRGFGYAYFRSPNRARLKLIVLGRKIFSLPLPTRRRNPEKSLARLRVFLGEGPTLGEPLGRYLERLRKFGKIDKFLFRAAVGLGDPAITGMVASSFYLLTSALPQEERRFAAVTPMFDRDGVDMEVELAVGFRAYRALAPWLMFILNPKVLRFSWRYWRPGRISKKEIRKETDHGRQILRTGVHAGVHH